jgi:hypothetical protein
MTHKWSMTCFFSPVLVLGILLVISESSQAFQTQRSPATSPADRTPANTKTAPVAKNETYSVIEYREEISVLANSKKTEYKKKADADYQSDLQKYNDARKDKKNADASSQKKPEKKDYVVKVLKAGFKTQDEAQKFADDKIKEQNDKGNAKKTTAGSTW